MSICLSISGRPPNYTAILSIYGHWIGPSGQRTNKLLAFRQVLGKNAGENQAQIVLEVLGELQIQDRIGCLGTILLYQ